MASTGNGNTGTTGTATSASQAQSQAAASNAAASNAANGKSDSGNTSASTSNNSTSTNTSTNTSTSNTATNSAGLMGSLMGFANNITGNVGETYGGGGGGTNPSGLNNSENNKDSKNDFGSYLLSLVNKNFDIAKNKFANLFTNEKEARNNLPAEVVEAGDKAYTEARKKGKSEEEAQYEARNAIRNEYGRTRFRDVDANVFEGKNIGPTYDPSIVARANTNPTIAKGSSEMSPSAPAPADTSAPVVNNAPATAPATSETAAHSVSESFSNASNKGVTYRGGTVTDSGTGGSISSSITPPTRDESSIGLGVYNNDRANYDQDNWNRGMESESSSLVSDEECKAFAKRAFMENSEPFKKVRILIVKNVNK